MYIDFQILARLPDFQNQRAAASTTCNFEPCWKILDGEVIFKKILGFDGHFMCLHQLICL